MELQFLKNKSYISFLLLLQNTGGRLTYKEMVFILALSSVGARSKQQGLALAIPFTLMIIQWQKPVCLSSLTSRILLWSLPYWPNLIQLLPKVPTSKHNRLNFYLLNTINIKLWGLSPWVWREKDSNPSKQCDPANAAHVLVYSPTPWLTVEKPPPRAHTCPLLLLPDLRGEMGRRWSFQEGTNGSTAVGNQCPELALQDQHLPGKTECLQQHFLAKIEPTTTNKNNTTNPPWEQH